MTGARERRPEGDRTPSKISHGDNTSVAAHPDMITAKAIVSGVHVVVVRTGRGRYRRRVYFNLPSAQRAADRAVMAGHSAEIVLCRLMPVSGGVL